MKKCFLFFSLFYINNCFAQLNETFSDGDFTQSPTWSGNQDAFYINSQLQLQSKEQDGGSVYLTTPSHMVLNTIWELDLTLKFSPSSYNFVRIYLCSDQEDLNQPLNGYYIEIGAAGTDDSFDLYKQVGEKSMLLIEGIPARAHGNTLSTRLKVENKNGTWTLFSQNKSESTFTQEGVYTNDELPAVSLAYFGLQCNYTKTRSNGFIFDNIKIYGLGEAPPAIETESSSLHEGDLLVNEILFNPIGKGVDFVEIYNNTEVTINLQKVSIATRRADTLTQIRSITNEPWQFPPHTFAVLTTNPGNIQEVYHTRNPEGFIQMKQMPAFNNDKGTVTLLQGRKVIDELNYTEGMHHPLLRNKKGVSLERVDYSAPTNQAGNFQSASATVGFATPGYANSQHREKEPSPTICINVEPKVFSPNNDGVKDLLSIHYKGLSDGTIAKVTLFNTAGHIVRRLIRNKTVETEGYFYWDGINENNSLSPAGIYLIHIEFITPRGDIKRYRKTCVLAVPR